jgi:membrane protease YdiL (CAAX protease family)
MSSRRKAALWLEFLLIFGGAPLIILAVRDRLFTIGVLWAGAAVMHFYTCGLNDSTKVEETPYREKIKYILIRFVMLAPVIAAATWILVPGVFLSFPRQRPWIWAIVVVLYPLLSVWPQEMIYRAFFYRRYAPLFGIGSGYVLASSLAFGYMHIIFINPVAVVLSVLGGLLFAWNYVRHQSLGLVSLEHSLYGCLIFTIGLGRFFFVGTAWRL